jgi:hypothetical protein
MNPKQIVDDNSKSLPCFFCHRHYGTLDGLVNGVDNTFQDYIYILKNH